MTTNTEVQQGEAAIGYVVEHDQKGGNFFKSLGGYEGMKQTYGDRCQLVYAAPAAKRKIPPRDQALCNDGSEPDWTAYAVAEAQQGAGQTHANTAETRMDAGFGPLVAAQQGGELPQDERKAFEVWAVSDGWHRLDAKGVMDGTITNIPHLQSAWMVWQAALAQRAASVPAQAVQPVAWRFDGFGTDETIYATEPHDIDEPGRRWTLSPDGWTPLYAAPAPAASVPDAGREPERFNTEQSREYLIGFMKQYFTDKTYHRYIRAERTGNNLAGDFAWQMARALRMIAAAAPQTTEKP